MDNDNEKLILIQNENDEISPSQRHMTTTEINEYDINSIKNKNNNNLTTNLNKDEIISNQINLKNNNNIRYDIFGNEIKKGKKYKISFSDQIKGDKIEEFFNEENDKKMAEIIYVDSYKKYNKIMNFSEEENNQEIVCCKSCLLF